MHAKNTTIHRFRVSLNHTVFSFDMPVGAEIVSIANDPLRNGEIQIWAAVNPEAETETRYFQRLDTGQALSYDPEDATYLGHAIGMGASSTYAGKMTPRHVHILEITGESAKLMADLLSACAG